MEQRQLIGFISRRSQVRILLPQQKIPKRRNMIKTYKAKTSIGINVVLASKKNLHISFITQSDGSSMFITDNEEVQKALERHYRFGTLFRLATTRSVSQPVQKEVESAREAAGETEEDTGKKNEKCKIPMSDYGAAKEYLADTFGVSRTSMRSQKQILDQAALHGIEFEGLS